MSDRSSPMSYRSAWGSLTHITHVLQAISEHTRKCFNKQRQAARNNETVYFYCSRSSRAEVSNTSRTTHTHRGSQIVDYRSILCFPPH
ncbi:unnamed protein product [Ectocarpus fasciculatus]